MTHALWRANEAIEATGGTPSGGRGAGHRDWAALGVSIDSRTVKPGDLFVALEGPNFDGHDFVGDALSKGAAAAVVHRAPGDVGGAAAPLLSVGDTLEALRALGRAGRARSKAKVVGVTGSSGKTSTKEALRLCLGAQGKTFASAGSFNNHWGVPLSLALLPPDADYAVFEMGMNHAGEIAELTRLVRPDVSIITTIGLAHIEFFDSQDGIAEAKSEIFLGMSPHGTAVLPHDDKYYARLVANAEAAGVSKIVSFGRHPEATLRLAGADLYASCSAVQAAVRGKPIDYCIAAAGEHWVRNSLAVLGAVMAVGGDVVEAAGEFARLQPVTGRGARRRIALPGGGEALLIDESYNANPDSVAAALAVLGRVKPEGAGRRIAILGDMLELGDGGPGYHAGLAAAVTAAEVDLAFLSGPLMKHLADALPASRLATHADTAAALAPRVADSLVAGDVVLVKGSLGSRMREVVAALDERATPANDTPRAANGG